MTLALKTDDENDVVYALNKDGEIQTENTISLTKDVISSKTTETNGDKTIDRYTSFNQDQANNFSKFLYDNTDVEWTNTNVTYTDENGKSTDFNTICTSHEDGKEYSLTEFTLPFYESVNNFIFNHGTYQINSMEHNHTNGNINPSAQMYDLNTNKSYGYDIGAVRRINILNRNLNGCYSIYAKGKYYEYDENANPTYLKEITVPYKP